MTALFSLQLVTECLTFSLQADVDLSILGVSESLTTYCWTPNGTLLLGTSEGRVLAVAGAAPSALPGQGWGALPLPATLLFSPVNLAARWPSASGSVISIVVSQAHITVVMAGGESAVVPGMAEKSTAADVSASCAAPFGRDPAIELPCWTC